MSNSKLVDYTRISPNSNPRKNADFNVSDRIKVYYDGNEDYEKALNNNLEFIKNETLAIEFIKDTSDYEVFDINDYDVKLKVEKL